MFQQLNSSNNLLIDMLLFNKVVQVLRLNIFLHWTQDSYLFWIFKKCSLPGHWSSWLFTLGLLTPPSLGHRTCPEASSFCAHWLCVLWPCVLPFTPQDHGLNLALAAMSLQCSLHSCHLVRNPFRSGSLCWPQNLSFQSPKEGLWLPGSSLYARSLASLWVWFSRVRWSLICSDDQFSVWEEIRCYVL